MDLIVLNWNGFEDTKVCLMSLRGVDENKFRTVIVDNNSSTPEYDKLVSWCELNYSLVIEYSEETAVLGGHKEKELEMENISNNDYIVIIRNTRNHGFAKGNNIGIRYSLERGNNSVFLLNNDTVARENSINKLVDFFSHQDEYDLVTPQILYQNPKDVIWNCGGNINLFGKTKYLHANKKIIDVKQDDVIDINFITGCALMYRANKVGLLSEKFFFGEEDVELSLRSRKLDFKMGCLLSSIIEHKVGSSIKSGTRKKLGAIYLGYISRLVNVKSYFSGPRLFIIRTYWACHIFLNLCLIRRQSISKSLFFSAKVLKDSMLYEDVGYEVFIANINKDFCHGDD